MQTKAVSAVETHMHMVEDEVAGSTQSAGTHLHGHHVLPTHGAAGVAQLMNALAC